MLGGTGICSSGRLFSFFFLIICITVNSQTGSRMPMNFPCIGMYCTVPFPVSSLAAEDKIFKMEPQYFLAFQNSAGELKELFVVPSMQISA